MERRKCEKRRSLLASFHTHFEHMDIHLTHSIHCTKLIDILTTFHDRLINCCTARVCSIPSVPVSPVPQTVPFHRFSPPPMPLPHSFRPLSLSLALAFVCLYFFVCLLNVVYLESVPLSANMSFVTYTQFLLLVMPKGMRMKAPYRTWTTASTRNCRPASCRTACPMSKRLRRPSRRWRKKSRRTKRSRVSAF